MAKPHSLAVAADGPVTTGICPFGQMEARLTQIFDRPLRRGEFFEEIIRDNLNLGRPDRVPLIFDRVVTKKTPAGSARAGFGPQAQSSTW
jgi:hypothetical protein